MALLEREEEERARAAFIAKMQQYEQDVAPEVYTRLVSDLGDPDDESPWRNWDLAGSIYYCMTLSTTIGYGSFGPVTEGGQLFSCFYAIVGIPLFVASLGVAGAALPRALFAPVFHWTEVYVKQQLAASFQLVHQEKDGEGVCDLAACKQIMRTDP